MPLPMLTEVPAESQPSGRQNLLELYGLGAISASVARTDPNGEKRKLRKSYKNQISDLPGKHTIPTREEAPPLVGLARRPPTNPKIAEIPAELLAQIKFARSPVGGIPGFGSKLFSTTPEPADKKRKGEQGGVEKKRRIV